MADYRKGLHLVPEHMRDSILQWIENPLPPNLMGSFMHALLSNDLMATLAHADEENVAALRQWGQYLYNYAPPGCYGSKENVATWYEAHQRVRAEDAASE